MIPLFKVYMSPDAGAVLNQTLYSGFLGEGPKVKEFEGLLSKWLETDRVLSLNSATSGLELATYMLRVPVDDFNKIHTTSLTCTATNWPILHQNCRPDWIDVDPSTLNMDLDDLRSKLDCYSAAVIVTHWGGRSHDMDAIAEIQREFQDTFGRRLIVIEDCAHAFGGFYKDQALGTFGDFGVYSFQAVKPLTTGDGGCFLSKRSADHDRAKLLRWYGIDRDNRTDDVVEAGFKYHMNDLAASIGIANIQPAHWNVQINIRNAAAYDEALEGIPGVTLLAKPPSHVIHPYWLYTILVDQRDDFMAAMKERGIETSIAHRRNDQYGCVASFKSSLPNLDAVSDRYVNIPVGWWVSEADRTHIIDSIAKGW